MARQKGMLNLSGNLEPLAGAPLDSRTITPTVADLYIASNWPYKYVGMKTTVTATGDTYRLVNLDVTQESSWVKEGGESGQTIQYDELPAASSSLAGKIYQYTGTTNVQYTNGYFYECVNDGGTYKWVQTNTQPGTSYNDFTGATSQTAGAHGLVPAPTTGDISKFLKGDGTWATVPMPSFDYSNTSPEAMNFSTDEKVIGTWIDGKPLYQKSVTLSNIETGSHAFDHNISNLGTITYAIGNLKRSDNKQVTIPFTYYGGLGSQLSVGDITSQKFTIFVGSDFGNLFNYANCGSVTFRYTKTTDTAVASGEKIVGQWIDGKPVFEKVVDCGALPNNASKIIAHNISNVDKIINAVGYGASSSGVSLFIGYVCTNSDHSGDIGLIANKTNIEICTYRDRSSYTESYVTLRYTKTT